jgi:hypothetical protein
LYLEAVKITPREITIIPMNSRDRLVLVALPFLKPSNTQNIILIFSSIF